MNCHNGTLPLTATCGIVRPVPAEVVIEPAAQRQFENLPVPIQARVGGVFERLADWPNVSGEKALTGDRKGSFRIRTGDYRVIYRVEQPRAARPTVFVSKIGDRRDVYE